MYKLFTDKAELFECSISLQGASLKESRARLVVETPDYSLLFNGNIFLYYTILCLFILILTWDLGACQTGRLLMSDP